MERDEEKKWDLGTWAQGGPAATEGHPSRGRALTDQAQSWGTWTRPTAGDWWRGPLVAPAVASTKPGLESIQGAKAGAKRDGARDRAGDGASQRGPSRRAAELETGRLTRQL